MTNKQTRRSILAGAAALPALAIIPAMAGGTGGVDPIFAAIERHRHSRAIFWTGVPTNDDAVMGARSHDHEQALADLLTTRPTTVAGCVAVLRHMDHHLAEYEDEEAQLLGNASDPVFSAGAVFLASIAAALDPAVQS